MINFLKVFFITVLLFMMIIIFCTLFLFFLFGFPQILASLPPLILGILIFGLLFITLFIAVYEVNKVDEKLVKGADKNE